MVLNNISISVLQDDLSFWLSGSDATTPSPSKQPEPPSEDQAVKVKVTPVPVLTSEDEDNSAKIDTHVSVKDLKLYYVNTPMQCTVNFNDCENDNFQIKIMILLVLLKRKIVGTH